MHFFLVSPPKKAPGEPRPRGNLFAKI
jgi:hypothetical protein